VFSGLVAGRWSGRRHWPVMLTVRCSSIGWSTHLAHGGGVFTYSSALYILLVHCPVDQFLGFSWENIYHSAIYFLVGGTVCSYVCIQESTLQCNVTMCHFVCPCCCYAVAWCVSLPECLAAATAAHLCDVLCWSSYHAVS
jgi:hypothetical protein